MQKPFFGVKFTTWIKDLKTASRLSREWGLTPVHFQHADYGGATNAIHMIAFGSSFGFDDHPFRHPPNVCRSIRHFWKPAESIPVKVCSGFPVVSGDHKRPLIHKGVLRVEGLFPVSFPCTEVCGPSVFHPGKLVRRRLSRGEFMAIFDVPAPLYDAFLQRGQWDCDTPLPFECAVSPVILTSLF
jgi:hypothetical protein